MKNLKKVLNFFTSKEYRRGFVFLILGLFFGMILEVIGLGILLPVLNILLDQEKLLSYEFFDKFVKVK